MKERQENWDNNKKFFENLELYQSAQEKGQDLPLLKEGLIEYIWKASLTDVLVLCARERISEFDQDDICSNTFISVRKGLKNLRGRTEMELRGWVKTIAQREIYRWFNQNKKKRNCERALVEKAEEAEEARQTERAYPNAEDEGPVNQEPLQWLRKNFFGKNLLKIKEELREVLLLHYLAGKPYKKIAQEKTISPECVRKRAFDGRKAIYEAFQKQFPAKEGGTL